MPPHPMMPMAALYGMPGHPYGPAMSMPGGGEGRKANRSTHLYTSGGYSVPQSVISGATTVRRARSVAEMSGHGGSPGGPGHHGSLGGHGQGGGQVGQIFCRNPGRSQYSAFPGRTKVTSRKHGLAGSVPPSTPWTSYASPSSDGPWREWVRGNMIYF